MVSQEDNRINELDGRRKLDAADETVKFLTPEIHRDGTVETTIPLKPP